MASPASSPRDSVASWRQATVSGSAARACRITIDGLRLTLLRDDSLETAVDAEALLRSEDVAEPPYWMHLWPGAMALAHIVARAPEIRPGVLLLELGCGLALPSIAAAVRGATVVTTDWEEPPLALAIRSARRNGRSIHALRMDFRKPAIRAPFDVLLAAEVGYDEQQVPALVDVTARLLRPGGVAWFSDSVNAYRTTLEDGLRAAGLRVRTRSRCEQEEGRPVWVRLIEARRP
jgi:predicted nicotinamide N-methyase